jgi:hypothetical protein
MNKLIVVLLVTFTAQQSYSADYFYCKDQNPFFEDDHYLIEPGGISKFRNGERWSQLSFKNLEHDVFKAITWAEPLTNKAKLWADYVPETYNEVFLAGLTTRHDVLISSTKLSCKRVYRLVGRP